MTNLRLIYTYTPRHYTRHTNYWKIVVSRGIEMEKKVDGAGINLSTPQIIIQLQEYNIHKRVII